MAYNFKRVLAGCLCGLGVCLGFCFQAITALKLGLFFFRIPLNIGIHHVQIYLSLHWGCEARSVLQWVSALRWFWISQGTQFFFMFSYRTIGVNSAGYFKHCVFHDSGVFIMTVAFIFSLEDIQEKGYDYYVWSQISWKYVAGDICWSIYSSNC